MDFLDEIETIFTSLKKYPAERLDKLDKHCIDMLFKLQERPDDEAVRYWSVLSVMVKLIKKQFTYAEATEE